MNKTAAIYARVCSDRQKENHTIASQTAALKTYAEANGYQVPPAWVFQDEGYSGANMLRPGLEALRDLAAEGQIAAALVYGPDRLSRKYAYQVLLAEELSRCGVELIFLKSPAGATPEDQLLLQFQGMIAEYERAQIAERTRRGKRHKAQQGVVSVLCGAPYGYRYVRKSDSSAAYTELGPRQRITRPLRQRQGLPSRDSAGHARPRADWIEVPVPALVSEEMFALAEEQLQQNKQHSPRRTIEPTLLQGMLVCQQCGYALYRTSTRTSKRKLYYYRCLGSDGYRRLKGSVCTNRPIRQDALDEVVWRELLHLLEDPALIQAEIDRRRAVATKADPLHKRDEELRREQARLEKNMDRLITAYQEGLVTLQQLRQRMPELRKQARAIEAELQSLKLAAVDAEKYLQLAESLVGFCSKLHARAETLEVQERQRILRLVTREVLVGGDTITLRHSIPVPPSGSGSNGSPAPTSGPSAVLPNPGYLLRKGSHNAALWRAFFARPHQPVFHHASLEHAPDQPKDPRVADPVPQ
ncbi:MAG: recombinase family protein, partial [Deltaproteobacteria bacterium]|nr:recombinase family protein [Deltaproteobacteria bacterium]